MENDKIVERFVEQMGLAAEQDRLPRIAGRIMGLLLLEGGPMGFDEIARRLEVSRGSISTNNRLLASLGVIEQVTKPGDRRDYFRISLAPGRELLRATARQLEGRTDMISQTRAALGSMRPEARKRLADLERFYSTVARGLHSMVAELDGR